MNLLSKFLRTEEKKNNIRLLFGFGLLIKTDGSFTWIFIWNPDEILRFIIIIFIKK